MASAGPPPSTSSTTTAAMNVGGRLEPLFPAGEAATAGREVRADGDADPASCPETDRPCEVASQAWYFA
jgi:hypothetical protein